MTQEAPNRPSYLVPITGPRLAQFTLSPDVSPLTLGRHEDCQLLIPAGEERISRHHARFEHQAGRWFVTDQKSTWGTYLNGYRLPPAKPHLLCEGDLLRITPWTFSFRSSSSLSNSIHSQDDLQQAMTIVRSVSARDLSAANDPIALLIEAAAGVHQTLDEVTLAELVIDLAQRGSGFSNVAYLRPSDADGRVEVIASTATGEEASYSRSLLLAASEGELALLDGGAEPTSQSIITLRIRSAMCVPLMLGQTIAAYLYLDTREQDGRLPHAARAPDFCLALARIASLALANIKRLEIERRQAALDSQLQQAAAIQQYILPPRHQRLGDLVITGQSRPGQLIGGDFFDVVALPDGCVALTLGDVAGKGVAASVLMTTIQGFLHALLENGSSLDDAVMRLNAFLEHRKPEERFATLFAALIDTRAGTLTYLDAAHGYGLLWNGDSLRALQEAGGPPVGAFAKVPYTSATVPFRRGDILLAVSDGIVEQPAGHSGDGERRQFEIDGIEQTFRRAREQNADELAALFEAVETHAGTPHLADDATILLAKWA